MIEDASAAPAPSSPSPAAATPEGSLSETLALSVLHEVLTALAHEETQDTVMNLLAEKARLLTGSASAAIVLANPESDSVAFVAVAGDEAEELRGSRVRLADTLMGNTARTGEPFFAFRPSSPVGSGNETSKSLVSAAVVPIFDQGKPGGALGALGKTGGVPFSGADLLCLHTLAAAASVVIGSSRLRSDTTRQRRELSILYDAVRNVSGQLSAQEVLQTVVEQARQHLDTAAVAVFLANDERTHLYIAQDDGLSDEDREVSLPAENGIGAALITTTQPIFLQFREWDEETIISSPAGSSIPLSRRGQLLTCDPFFQQGGARSGIAAPIASGGDIQGVVVALSGQPFGVYTDTDANLLGALASQAAVAMENAWLYEDATRRAEEATTLYELSQTVTSTLRLGDVLERVADAVLSLMAVDKFALFLQETNSDALRLVVTRNLAPGAEERIRPQIGQGIPGWVMEFETPTAVQDVAADHRNASAPLHNEGVVSMTCMPLQVGAATIGVLCAMSSRRRLFTVAEMELLYTVANQAAIAIENARMYADVRQKSLELRRYFHRVARTLGSAQTPDEVPQLIASLTLEVMGADRCALYVLREENAEEVFACVASEGFRIVNDPFSQMRPARENTPMGWVARRAKSLAVEDINEDPRFSENYDRPLRGRAVSYLGVPLRRGEKVIGVLEVYSRGRRLWRGDEIRLMLTFASQATVAFQNARLARKRADAERQGRILSCLLQHALSNIPVSPSVLARELTAALEQPFTLWKKQKDEWHLLSDPPEAISPSEVAALQNILLNGEISLPAYHVEKDDSLSLAVAVRLSDVPPTAAPRVFPPHFAAQVFALLRREQASV